jgi:hypothetical protein
MKSRVNRARNRLAELLALDVARVGEGDFAKARADVD